jgi:hypothetical protein
MYPPSGGSLQPVPSIQSNVVVGVGVATVIEAMIETSGLMLSQVTSALVNGTEQQTNKLLELENEPHFTCTFVPGTRYQLRYILHHSVDDAQRT